MARTTQDHQRYASDLAYHEVDKAEGGGREHHFLFHPGVCFTIGCSALHWERVSRPDRLLPQLPDRFPGGPSIIPQPDLLYTAAMKPEIVVIAGPNGAGKSTLARLLLPEAMPFLNADEIAKALPDSVGNREIESGREMIRRMESLVAKRQSFAIETTLSSRSLAPRIARMKEEGYRFQLIFLSLPSPKMAIERVASRVRRGGHSIPEEVIRRRLTAGLSNFTQLYQPIADHWQVYQNTQIVPPLSVASSGQSETNTGIFDDEAEVLRRFQVAVREALLDHKRAGNSVAIWRDGKVVIVPPEEIDVSDSGKGL